MLRLASHSFIIPEAQPTPASTQIAPTGQLSAHAPHSIQLSKATMAALRPVTINTWWGQTKAQTPQPMHVALSSLSVATFSR
jgi:hypothetical protein